ncbi:IMP dehydrogenase, partial [Enterobacter hormaechei]|uniref:IMP dehydrogenase n=1 Tax=Enterobacter hormaechei TaxID=158836 RepID=UPI0034D735E4
MRGKLRKRPAVRGDNPPPLSYTRAAKRRIPMEIREGLTFDDVLLEPAASEVMPGQVNTATKFTREISLNIP